MSAWLIAIGGGALITIGVIANFAQIADYLERKWEAYKARRNLVTEQPQKLRPNTPIRNAKPYIIASAARHTISSESFRTTLRQVQDSASLGRLIVVRTPMGGFAEELTELFARWAEQNDLQLERVPASWLLDANNPMRSLRRHALTLVASSSEREILSKLNDDPRRALLHASGELARSKGSTLIAVVTRSLEGVAQLNIDASRLTVIEYAVRPLECVSTLCTALFGTSDVVALDRECMAWLEEIDLAPGRSRVAAEQASAARRFIAGWQTAVRTMLSDASPESLALAFCALCHGIERPTPKSILVALGHYGSGSSCKQILEQMGLDLVLGSNGLLRIALRSVIDGIRDTLAGSGTQYATRVLGATPLGVGDVPPWLIDELDRRLWSRLDDSEKQMIASAIRAELRTKGGSRDDPFFATNALRLNNFLDGPPIREFAGATLRWPLFDQKSYDGFDFSNCEFIEPSLPDNFGPVTAVHILENEDVVFGSFTGELRFCRRNESYPEFAERIDDHAVARILTHSHYLDAFTYSGRVHRLDLRTRDRVGTAIETSERFRDAALDNEAGIAFVVSETGTLFRYNLKTRDLEPKWRSSGSRLKAISLLGSGRIAVGTDEGRLGRVDKGILRQAVM